MPIPCIRLLKVLPEQLSPALEKLKSNSSTHASVICLQLSFHISCLPPPLSSIQVQLITHVLSVLVDGEFLKGTVVHNASQYPPYVDHPTDAQQIFNKIAPKSSLSLVF